MSFKSINPYNNEEIASYSEHSDQEIESILKKSEQAFGVGE